MIRLLTLGLWTFSNYYLMSKMEKEKLPQSPLFFLYWGFHTLLLFWNPIFPIITIILSNSLWLFIFYRKRGCHLMNRIGLVYLTNVVIECMFTFPFYWLASYLSTNYLSELFLILESICLILFASTRTFIKLYQRMMTGQIGKLNQIFLYMLLIFVIFYDLSKSQQWIYYDVFRFLPIMILFFFLFLMAMIHEKLVYEELKLQYQDLSLSRKELDRLFRERESKQRIYRDQLLVLKKLSIDDSETKRYVEEILKLEYDRSYQFLGEETIIQLNKIENSLWRQNLYYKLLELRKQNVKISIQIEIDHSFQKQLEENEILTCDVLLVCNLMLDLARTIVEDQKSELNLVFHNDQKKIYINCLLRIENNLNLLKRVEESYLIANIIDKNDTLQYSHEVVDDVYIQVLEIF